MTCRTLKRDPALRARRAAIRAYWEANPTARASDVGERFGVTASTALDHKPFHLRQFRGVHGQRRRRLEADALALKLYAEDRPLVESAEATGRGIATTRRVLLSVTAKDGTPPA